MCQVVLSSRFTTKFGICRIDFFGMKRELVTQQREKCFGLSAGEARPDLRV